MTINQIEKYIKKDKLLTFKDYLFKENLIYLLVFIVFFSITSNGIGFLPLSIVSYTIFSLFTFFLDLKIYNTLNDLK